MHTNNRSISNPSLESKINKDFAMQPLGENTANTPAFLGKLWKMVNDPATDNLICWSPSGTSFVIPNQAQFWYKLLPLYYKHNNMSSFVRQLNMYGFHKMSTVENGAMDSDKDEIQFSHPFFIKDHPELLRNIKRKVTNSKSSSENNHDELTKVLTDVKQLRGRQASVDNQLNAMKEENALLWREVAILRQKHLKQQKIVNKLIQFLVTLVQPSRMTVGVKRGYQLMLNESPIKKSKATCSNDNNVNAEGPTIHELDSELDLTPNLYDEDTPVINSPAASSVGSQPAELNSPLQSQLLADDNGDDTTWDKPEFVTVEAVNAPEELGLVETELTDENLINTLDNEPTIRVNNDAEINDKIFLNPSAQNKLLSNLIKNNFTVKSVNKAGEKDNNSKIIETMPPPLSPIPVTSNNMAIATCDTNVCDVIKSLPSTSDVYNPEVITNHIETTQNQLEQFKDILNGYNSFVDANALLGELNKIPQNFKDVYLFSDDSPVYDLNTYEDKNENLIDSADPLVSGSELTPYGNNFDFTELFDDSIDVDNLANVVSTSEGAPSTINTPQIIKEEPLFPVLHNKK